MTSSPRGSAVRRSSSRAFAALLVARAVMEAIAFACLLALVHMPGGLEPLALTPTTFALIGATLVLVAALRETGSEGRGTAIVGTTLGVGLLVAVLLPTHPLDVVSWGGRIITFVIVAEIYLWRVVSLARGAVRWSDARNAVPFGALALTFDEIVFTLLLPIGYLAALVYALLEPLLRRWNPFSLPSQGAPSDDVAMLRNIERTRPLVVGGLEIVVVIVVLLVAVVLFE